MSPASAAAMLEKAEAVDLAAAREMDRYAIVKSALYTSGEIDHSQPQPRDDLKGQLRLMGHDPRLPKMPDKPTLIDFFRLRFGPCVHMMQSARLAQKNGCGEKLILACVLHDIGNNGFIRADHGYWAAQLVEPYVDEEVTFAIRYHQALRFYPDDKYGYEYPESYVRMFGKDFHPGEHMDRYHDYAKKHKYYEAARLLTVNDLYAFDPSVNVDLEEFTDIIGRNFRQPKEGLGFDDSPTAHMWRTINWPTRYL
jgi:hypothetical protein